MSEDTIRASLSIPATRHGHYLTAGPAPLTLEFKYDSEQCGRAMHLLVNASEDANARVVPIALGEEVLFIDPSLHTDLGAELLVLMVERDLGALMDEYRPDSSPLH
jgi:hypothetical protein